MKELLDTILGTYDPIWKSILIDHDAIKSIEKNNPNILENLVYVHENYHWVQLTSTSLGHLITLLPFFQRKTVQALIEMPEQFGRRIDVKNPLYFQTEQFSDIEIRILNNDLLAIKNFASFILNTNDIKELSEKFKEYNQAMFSIFDMYLMFSKEIIVQCSNEDEYKVLVKKNRDFWDRKENYSIYAFSKDLPLLGFVDLVECAARIVEMKYYYGQCEIYKIARLNKSIDTSYFYNKNYFKPMDYIQLYFGKVELTDTLQNFLLIAIYISTNPSVVPFYRSTFSTSNDITNIHPGMRFVKILKYIKNKYNNIDSAMENKNLYKEICQENKWASEDAHEEDLRTYYEEAYRHVNSLENNGVEYITGRVYDIEYYIYMYYKVTILKTKFHDYFIDPNIYLAKNEYIEIYREIDNNIHCPVYFNLEKGMYQVNISGMEICQIDENGEIKVVESFKKQRSKKIEQEFLNYLILGMFYELDNQLLFSKELMDYSILQKFDIGEIGREELKQLYIKERHIK